MHIESASFEGVYQEPDTRRVEGSDIARLLRFIGPVTPIIVSLLRVASRDVQAREEELVNLVSGLPPDIPFSAAQRDSISLDGLI